LVETRRARAQTKAKGLVTPEKGLQGERERKTAEPTGELAGQTNGTKQKKKEARPRKKKDLKRSRNPRGKKKSVVSTKSKKVEKQFGNGRGEKLQGKEGISAGVVKQQKKDS